MPKEVDPESNKGSADLKLEIAVTTKLYDDLEKKFYPEKKNPKFIAQLIDDKLLPPGTQVINLSKMRQQLAEDEQTLQHSKEMPVDKMTALHNLSAAEVRRDRWNGYLNASQVRLEQRMSGKRPSPTDASFFLSQEQIEEQVRLTQFRKDRYDREVEQAQIDLNQFNRRPQDIMADRIALNTRIRDLQALLQPDSTALSSLGTLQKGSDYYRAAENILGRKDQMHSANEEQELKLLSNVLEVEASRSNDGQPLLRSDNLPQIFKNLEERRTRLASQQHDQANH